MGNGGVNIFHQGATLGRGSTGRSPLVRAKLPLDFTSTSFWAQRMHRTVKTTGSFTGLVLFKTGSLYSEVCPGTCWVDQVGQELPDISRSLPS